MFFAANRRRTVRRGFDSAAGFTSGLYRQVTWLLPTSAASLPGGGGSPDVRFLKLVHICGPVRCVVGMQ